jgi:aminopeptidase YwaD
MEFLASDALAGRGSGTRDEWIAATYVAAHMRRIGLEPAGDDGGFVQTVTIERVQAAAAPVLSFAGGRFVHGEQMLVLSMRAARLSGLLYKLTTAGELPKGAVALLPPDLSSTAAPPPNAQGAALLLALETSQVRRRWSDSAARLPSLPTQISGIPPQPSTRPPTIVLATDAYEKMSALANGTPITFEAELKPVQTARTWNVVGRLTGSGAEAKDEVILLSAHLDHVGTRSPPSASNNADVIYNGADDDASGTVAVLELASSLAKQSRQKRTIVFALFGSEESGGLGSRYFAERMPLAGIVANLQFEMIGRPDPKVPPQTLWLTGYERSTLGATLARHGARLVKDPHPEQNFFMRSDNYQFARRGVVAHTVSSYGLHKDYHQPSDEVDRIDFAHMTRAIASMLEPINWLANSDFKPEWMPGMKPNP